MQMGQCCGRVEVEINPAYYSHGRPCTTFGWLDANTPEVTKILLFEVALWAGRQRVKVNGKLRRSAALRGPISFPKIYGGLGCQVEGFEEPRLAGVSLNRPELADWITCAGFHVDAPYLCIDISKTPVWRSASDEISGLTLVTLTAAEWMERAGEIASITGNAFTNFSTRFYYGTI